MPLLPGYGANTKARSSPAIKSPGGISLLERMNEAEEVGYHDGFFPVQPQAEENNPGGDGHGHSSNDYLLSTSPTGDGAMGRQDGDREGEGAGGGGGVGSGFGILELLPTVMEDREPSPTEERQERERESENATGAGGSETTLLNDEHRSPTSAEFSDHSSEERDRQAEQDHRESANVTRDEEKTYTPSPRLEDGEDPFTDPPSQTHLESSHNLSLSQDQERDFEKLRQNYRSLARRKSSHSHKVAEVVFFEYGVTVFFGLSEKEERDILEDCESAGAWFRGIPMEDWETEECHYVSICDAGQRNEILIY